MTTKTAVAPAPEITDDPDEFRARFGYPIDAKRLPAGTYTLLTGWNQLDPTHPEGVRTHRKGAAVTVTTHEASRLLHIGSIADPDAVAEQQASDVQALIADVEAQVDGMRAQFERHRKLLTEKAKSGRADLAELDAQIARLTAERDQLAADIDANSKAAALSDEETAAVIGGSMPSVFGSLTDTLASLRSLL